MSCLCGRLGNIMLINGFDCNYRNIISGVYIVKPYGNKLECT